MFPLNVFQSILRSAYSIVVLRVSAYTRLRPSEIFKAGPKLGLQHASRLRNCTHARLDACQFHVAVEAERFIPKGIIALFRFRRWLSLVST